MKTKLTEQHSRTPWHVTVTNAGKCLVKDAAGETVAQAFATKKRGQNLANARAIAEAMNAYSPRQCRECGCTNDDCIACIERTGEPCHWVEEDLCSACASRPTARKRKGSRT